MSRLPYIHRVAPRRRRPLLAMLCVAALVGAGFGWRAASSQGDAACFSETGYCISGRVREVWERSGGLAAFGFPITPLQAEPLEGQTRVVQWFERARFELHPTQAPPYDVQLGRLSVELLGRRGQEWQVFDRLMPLGDCRIFSETGQAVCGDFLAAWRSTGLSLDADSTVSEAESLALFGLPLSGLRAERLSDGKLYVVQWFERARFELHPENGPPYRVLLGLLGGERAPTVGTPWVPPTPTPLPIIERQAPGPAPVRIVIPQIGLDRAITPVGMRGIEFVVPDLEVGWFDQSATPGQGENIVLWGHVLPFLYAPNASPPFARLNELPVGALITLYDAFGQAVEYQVIQQVTALPEAVEYIFPSRRELLTMVSCIGEDVVSAGNVVDKTHRLITIAEPLR